MECYGFFVFYIVILPPHAASESDNPPQPIDTAKRGKSLELPYGVGIVGKVGNELGRTQ